MQPVDFIHNQINAKFNLNDPLAVLAKKLHWSEIEADVAQKFERQVRTGPIVNSLEMLGTTEALASPSCPYVWASHWTLEV